MPYATDEDIELAKSLGYEHSRSHQSGDHFGKHTKGAERRVWSIMYGAAAKWQTADIVNGYYTNHLPYKDLSDALRRPLIARK